MKTVSTFLGLATIIASSAVCATSSVQFADPAPDKGIGYEWSVSLDHTGASATAEFVRHVGAKSSYEPANPAPEVGWQHTSDWVALELKSKSLLTIEVMNQRGVQYTTISDGKAVENTAGQGFFPAFSLYSGWDDTSTEDHTFNPIGDFWSTIRFIGADYVKGASAQHGGESMRSIKKQFILPAGNYSLNIGGINAIYCDVAIPCYNGRHGYRAKLTAEPMPTSAE